MGSLSPDSTAGPHLEHCGAEEHPVDSAEGARDARRSHDLHTHSYGTRQVGAQGLRKVLCRPKTSENDHAYPPTVYGGTLCPVSSFSCSDQLPLLTGAQSLTYVPRPTRCLTSCENRPREPCRRDAGWHGDIGDRQHDLRRQHRRVSPQGAAVATRSTSLSSPPNAGSWSAVSEATHAGNEHRRVSI